jgi:protein-S-isoprenylcysteine O-methyltransferase Ste14
MPRAPAMRRSAAVTQQDDERDEPAGDEERAAGAQVQIPPPAVFAGALVLALLLGWIWPRDPWLGGALRWVFGLASVGSGVGMIATAFSHFRRTQQDAKPWTPATEMITEGPYAFTRNPMYLGLVSIMIGLGYLVGNGWFAITAILAALVVQKLAIEPEEAYLEEKFGDDYRAYKRRVRRWI